MYKTIEAYYKNGKIIYKEAMPHINECKAADNNCRRRAV